MTPRLDPARFALADATAAYDSAASGRAAGKVVIAVGEGDGGADPVGATPAEQGS